MATFPLISEVCAEGDCGCFSVQKFGGISLNIPGDITVNQFNKKKTVINYLISCTKAEGAVFPFHRFHKRSTQDNICIPDIRNIRPLPGIYIIKINR